MRNVVTEENRDIVLQDDIREVQFMPDGTLAVAIGHDLIVLDLSSGKETSRLGDAWITAIAPSPSGEILALGDNSGNVRLGASPAARRHS